MASENEFAGTLYRSSNEMYLGIAETWITANGWNGREFIEESFAQCTDLELAAEAFEEWNLEEDGRNVDVLAWAFAELRKEWPNWFIGKYTDE